MGLKKGALGRNDFLPDDPVDLGLGDKDLPAVPDYGDLLLLDDLVELIAAHAQPLACFGDGEESGHSSPRYSRIRFRVAYWSRVIRPLTRRDAHPFVRSTLDAISLSVIRDRAHLWIYFWMSLMSFLFVMVA